MPRYIDAHRAKNLLIMCGTYHGVISFDTVIHVLHDTQTADVVEVVRCRDCKNKEREQPGMVYCPLVVGSWVPDDHFCKWGERGEDDND